MRDHIQITVSSYAGARHFTLTQLMRRCIAATAGVVGLLFLIGSLAIGFMSIKLGELDRELVALKAEQQHYVAVNRGLKAEQASLLQSVEDKVAALSMVSEELENIESMIGVKPESDTSLYSRLNTASQTAFEKRYMLNTIPSGSPLDQTVVTSSFGMRKHPVLGGSALHGGIDLRAKLGTPVYATADGVVERVAVSEGFGRMIRVRHNFGFTTVYAHLQAQHVAAGEFVSRGELLGYSGNTGLSSAPHLHYEIWHLHRRLKPAPFMDWSIENYEGLFNREEKIQWDSLARTLKNQIAVPERRWSQRAPVLLETSS